MEADSEEIPVELGEPCQLPDRMWYVHCNHYTEMRFEARDEAAAEHKLENEMNWRLSV